MIGITRNDAKFFALTVPKCLTAEQIRRLRAEWDRDIGAPLIVLEPGFRLDVFTREGCRDLIAPAGWDTLENVR